MALVVASVAIVLVVVAALAFALIRRSCNNRNRICNCLNNDVVVIDETLREVCMMYESRGLEWSECGLQDWYY